MVTADRGFLPRLGGAALIAGSVGFIAVFSFLAATFGYPEVLEEPASSVLPALQAGGTTMRAVWIFYAAIPSLLLVAGISSMPFIERGAGRTAARFGGALMTIASFSMMVGLLRWPSIQWALAERWQDASTSQQATYAAIFDGANTYLGNVLGEYIGETMLAGWFVVMGLALRGMERRTLGIGSIAMGVIVAVSAQRQLTGIVDPISSINNALLPLSLIVLGVVLWRDVKAPRLSSEMSSASALSTV